MDVVRFIGVTDFTSISSARVGNCTQTALHVLSMASYPSLAQRSKFNNVIRAWWP